MSRHLPRAALRAQQLQWHILGPVALRARSDSPVPRTIPFIGIHSAGLHNRQFRLDQVNRAIHTESIGLPFPARPVGERQSLVLRPYQQEAINACLAGLGSGLRRLGVSAPTGSGKTTIFMSLIPRIRPSSFGTELGAESDDKGRTLILVGREELVTQAEVAARNILGEKWSIEVEQGRRAASGKANITIAMWQSIIKPERLAKFDPAKLKLVIVDEAHHAGSRSYLRLLHHFNSQVVLPPDVLPLMALDTMLMRRTTDGERTVPIIGFSATFSRPDRESLARVFEEIVFHKDLPSMFREGWLAPAKATSVYVDLNLDADPAGAAIEDFRTSWLADRVNTPAVNQLVVRTYSEKCQDRRSTVVFCVNRRHIEDLTRAFQDAGVDARMIDGITKPLARAQILGAFRQGEFPVLVNCEILTEGTDIPEIDCIILARPTKSANLLAQMLGRGLRQSPRTDKTDCYFIDVVDNLSQGLNPMACLGILPEEKDKEASISVTAPGGGRNSSAQEVNIDLNKVKLVNECDPFGVRAGGLAALLKISKNAWVTCRDDYYALDLLGQGCIVVEPLRGDNRRWTATYHPHTFWTTDNAVQQSDPIQSSSRQMAVGESLASIIGLADKYVTELAGTRLDRQLSRHAQWRSRPASEKQIQLLRSLGGQQFLLKEDKHRADILEVGGRAVSLADLTAGEVDILVCAFKHGRRAIKVHHAPKEGSTVAEADKTPDAQGDLEPTASIASTDKPFYQKIRDFLPAFLV